MSRWKKNTLRLLLALCVLALASAFYGYFWLRASAPLLDGTLHDPSFKRLSERISIARDAQGTAVIHGKTRLDAVFAQGFVHAQERYFEMDLARRSAAGELAELFGAAALPRDKATRVHRMRSRMQGTLKKLPEASLRLLESYQAGVNAGLRRLNKPPFTYGLMGKTPRAWALEDSLLINAAMFFNLQDQSNGAELRADTAQRVLSKPAFAFLYHRTSAIWDAPLMPGAAIADPALPTPIELNLRSFDVKWFSPTQARAAVTEAVRGSNSWAVSGRLSATGSAIFANDMHLNLGVPSLWFRTQLNYPHPETGEAWQVTGLSLPGAAGTVTGSNGHVAWGMTNAYGDWMDFVRITPAPSEQASKKDPERYLSASGEQLIERFEEEILVSGASSERLLVRETRYGPITTRDAQGKELALAWAAHRQFEEAGQVQLGIDGEVSNFELERSAEALIGHATRAGMPHNNVLAADRAGAILWTIGGRVPLRAHHLPMADIIDSDQLSADVWSGFLAPENAPKVSNPSEGVLYTANARVVNQEALKTIGNGNYALGARATRIKTLLENRAGFTEAYLHSMQLDVQAPLLDAWWNRLLKLTDAQPRYSGVREVLHRWNRTADPDSAAYRVVRNFRLEVLAEMINAFSVPVRAAENLGNGDDKSLSSEFTMPFSGHAEVIVWPVLQAQAPHLLPQPYQNYAEFEFACLDRALAKMLDPRYLDPGFQAKSGIMPFAKMPLQDSQLSADTLEDHPWGEQNTTRIRHPLTLAVPALSWLLNMPAEPVSGDTGHIVRAQGPSFGASERLVVSPGHEQNGILHMPGGQSGHPLSPYFGAGHQDWVRGTATPLLPGPIQHTLILENKSRPSGTEDTSRPSGTADTSP